ncbi:hypothetical protein QFC21_001940 [Naganishia friedmannii]|uniref:Uncharacterized protein n=1 Tax=Naganishia friedmannii TaxID=89922 RepID=A0ACC2W016_9TREE|nr:hypothetical protein QFC21_001940 [Naganishia friedmannii]
MSRKHGGLARKDALKGRKGARSKQDIVARGDNDMSTTLVIPKDGNIGNAKFVSKDFIRKGPEFDKYRLEGVYDEQTGEYKTQPYEINAKQPLCPPSPPETPATRTARERRLPDMEDSGRQDNEGADMIPDQDYTILSSKHFSLRSPIKRSDPQSYSPLVESFTSVAQGSSFAAASCASFPSSPEPPVAGPSRPSGLPASATSLQQEGVRQAAKVNKQHKAAFSSRNAYSPAPKNVTPAVSRPSVASATHEFSNSAESYPAGSAREKQLFGLYLSALEAEVGIDFKGEWNGAANDATGGIDQSTLEDALSDFNGSWHGDTDHDETLFLPYVKTVVSSVAPASSFKGIAATLPSPPTYANSPPSVEGLGIGIDSDILRDDAQANNFNKGRWQEGNDDVPLPAENSHSSSPIFSIAKCMGGGENATTSTDASKTPASMARSDTQLCSPPPKNIITTSSPGSPSENRTDETDMKDQPTQLPKSGKAKSREHRKKKRDGVLADGNRGVARDGKLGEIIVPEPDTRPFASDTRPDRTQKGPILIVGSAHNGIETDDDLRMAKERDADAYSVQWVKQVTEDWEADKSVRIDVFGPQYDKYRLKIIYDEEGKCWSTQPYFKNAESLMPLPTTTVSLSSITSAFGSEPQQNTAVEEDVHRMEYVMVNGNNASLAAEHSAPAEPFESPPHPVISTVSVANESSFETTAEEAPTIDELVQQFFEALIQRW